jgi:hypothetical protein
MCRPVGCSACGKVTWAGCGAHVDQVMRGVPAEQRCRCRDEKPAAPPEPRRSWWRR